MKFRKSISFYDKLLLVLGSFSVIVLWMALMKVGLRNLYSVSFFGMNYTNLGKFVFVCVFAPMWEELVFRHAPIQIAIKFKKALKQDFTIPIVIISSAIFGWGHGAGPISLVLQGVIGLVLSFVYIKNGNSYWSAVVVHFLWNFGLSFVFPLLK